MTEVKNVMLGWAHALNLTDDGHTTQVAILAGSSDTHMKGYLFDQIKTLEHGEHLVVENIHTRNLADLAREAGLMFVTRPDTAPDNEWSAEYRQLAEAEGWNVFDRDSTGSIEIQRDDEQNMFPDDASALQWVLANAKDKPHCRRAIYLCFGI